MPDQIAWPRRSPIGSPRRSSGTSTTRPADWGYGASEALSQADILAENYRGIRPAFGYPACPDHSPKAALFALLDNAAHHRVSLTESYAMYPTASVSGLYFAHPAAIYFAVGRQR